MSKPIDKRALILRWIEEQEALCEAAEADPWEARSYDRGLSWKVETADRRNYVASYIGGLAGICEGNARLIAASRSVLPLALAALRAEVERHSRWGIYDECGHQHAEGEAGTQDVEDVGTVCEEGLVYAVCEACHTDDGEPRENTDEGAWPCPTIDRLFCSLGLQDSGR